MNKYISISLNLEESSKDNKKIKLTLSDNGTETKGNIEYNQLGSKFSIDINGFATGYLDYVIDTLAKKGIFEDNNSYSKINPDVLNRNSSKTLEIKIIFPDGFVKQKQLNGVNNPYHNIAYEMLKEPFKKCLSGSPITAFDGYDIPHYKAFHRLQKK